MNKQQRTDSSSDSGGQEAPGKRREVGAVAGCGVAAAAAGGAAMAGGERPEVKVETGVPRITWRLFGAK